MEEILKMDIFFVITSVVVLVMGILGSLVLYFLVKILNDIRDITKTVKKETVEIAEDFGAIRADVKEGVHEVREHVSEGIDTAKKVSQAVAGAKIVKGLSTMLDAFGEEKAASATRKKRTTRKKKSE